LPDPVGERGDHAPALARALGCSEQAVRNGVHAFNRAGLGALHAGSSRPHTLHVAFDAERAERLRTMLHRSPRAFGQPTSLWTLAMAAEVAFDEGLTPVRVSGETIRVTLRRLGVRWRRAKQWISSPDPAYARKKAGAAV
jgi:transposase